MSDTAPPAPAAPPATGFFQMIVTGIEHGANTVYARVVAIEADATKWEAANPAIAPLIKQGEMFASNFITKWAGTLGVPIGPLVAVGEDVLAALKALAAADPTVATVASAAAPAAPTAGA